MPNSASLTLDGSGDYAARSADDNSLDLTSEWTIECWYKTSDMNTVVNQWMIEKGNRFEQHCPFSMSIQWQDLYVVYRNNYNTFGVQSYGLSTYNDGGWHHFCGTYDGSDIVVYIDGSLATSATSLASPPVANSRRFGVGTGDNGSFEPVGQACKFDEVRIWDHARSGAEVADYFDKQAAGDETGLVACYRFNSDHTDETSNALDLTAGGGATFDTGDYPTLTDAGGGGTTTRRYSLSLTGVG